MWDRTRQYSRIKLCEFESLDAAYEASVMGIDALGFHLFAHQNLGERVGRFGEIFRNLPGEVEKVLLTDLDLPVLWQVLFELSPGCIQLYPDWTTDEVAQLRQGCGGLRVLKVMSARPEENFTPDYTDFLRRYEPVVDGFLLDSFRQGGTGKPADWRACVDVIGMTNLPVFLAGGLTAENVADAIRIVRPFGLDSETAVSVRLPNGSLVKSMEQCRRFVDAVMRADRERVRGCDSWLGRGR